MDENKEEVELLTCGSCGREYPFFLLGTLGGRKDLGKLCPLCSVAVLQEKNPDWVPGPDPSWRLVLAQAKEWNESHDIEKIHKLFDDFMGPIVTDLSKAIEKAAGVPGLTLGNPSKRPTVVASRVFAYSADEEPLAVIVSKGSDFINVKTDAEAYGVVGKEKLRRCSGCGGSYPGVLLGVVMVHRHYGPREGDEKDGKVLCADCALTNAYRSARPGEVVQPGEVLLLAVAAQASYRRLRDAESMEALSLEKPDDG